MPPTYVAVVLSPRLPKTPIIKPAKPLGIIATIPTTIYNNPYSTNSPKSNFAYLRGSDMLNNPSVSKF